MYGSGLLKLHVHIFNLHELKFGDALNKKNQSNGDDEGEITRTGNLIQGRKCHNWADNWASNFDNLTYNNYTGNFVVVLWHPNKEYVY